MTENPIEYRWAYALHEEESPCTFAGQTREECIEAGTKAFDGEPFYICRARPMLIDHEYDIDAVENRWQNVIENSESVGENCDDPTDEEYATLMNLLNEAVEKWLGLHPHLRFGGLLEVEGDVERIVPTTEVADGAE